MRIDPEPDIALVAALIGEPARGAMLSALLGGGALSAGALARAAGVAPATASVHLARLVDGGLLQRTQAGRHRYYAIADDEVAAALEALARIAPSRSAAGADALRFARTCYDHLAGRVGVLLTDTLLERGMIRGAGYDLTPGGDELLGKLGIDAGQLRAGRRALTRRCLDWSERRDHLAGAVGAAIAATMLERKWFARLAGTRALRLTLRGREGLYRTLAMTVD